MKHIFRLLDNLLSIILSLLVISMTCIIFIAVIYRYLLNEPLLFSFELTVSIFVWIVFLGLSQSYTRGLHLGLNIIDNYISTKMKYRLEVFRSLVVASISIYLLFISTPIAMNTKIELNSLGISSSYVYFAIPIGFLFLTVVLFFNTFKKLNSVKQKL